MRKMATLAVVALVAAMMIQPVAAGVGGCRAGVGGCRGWEINTPPAGPDRPSSPSIDRTPTVYDALSAVLPVHVVVTIQTIFERPDQLELYVDGVADGVGGCRGRGGVGGCVQ